LKSLSTEGAKYDSQVTLSAKGAKYDSQVTLSAKGAKYESQGQALSEAKRVAPG
jgi:phosphotransferase system HPr-like phosphotransfer protein